jgi:hypothetical protein
MVPVVVWVGVGLWWLKEAKEGRWVGLWRRGMTLRAFGRRGAFIVRFVYTTALLIWQGIVSP